MKTDALSKSNHLDESIKKENEEYQIKKEVEELKITYATDLEGDPAEKTKEGGFLLNIFVNRDRFDYSCRVIVPLLKYSGLDHTSL